MNLFYSLTYVLFIFYICDSWDKTVLMTLIKKATTLTVNDYDLDF